MSKISELSDGGSLVSSDYLIAVRSGGNVKVRMDQINVDQVDLGDNEFIRLGNSQDLTMVHTSTQSIINQAGIGDLLLQKAGVTKLTINASGIDVAGSVTAGGNIIPTGGSATAGSIWKSGANMLISMDTGGFYINNSADTNTAFQITDAGNVGIGGAPLANNQLLLTDAGTYSQFHMQNSTSGSGASDGFRILMDGVNTTITNHENGYMAFETQNTERLRIDSAGNVGIGTSSPNGNGILTLNTPADNSAQIVFAENDTAKWLIGHRHDGDYFRFYDLANSAERMRIDASGRVGIGVASPSSYYSDNLVVNGGFEGGITIVGATNHTNYLSFADGTTGADAYRGMIGYEHTTNNMQFRTAGVERMRLDASGNLLVGKTAGNSPAIIGFETQQDGEVYSTIATGYNTYHVYANSGYRFYVNPNGGIYNYSANNVNLSDEREKKNIELLESQWDSLKQWSLKKFHYNADADSDNKKLGVIAQEVEAHNPEIISKFNVDETTTRMAVKEQQMMWMAIKALQEAQTRIESLEARIAALES